MRQAHQAIVQNLISDGRDLAILPIAADGTLDELFIKTDTININGDAVFDVELNGVTLFPDPDDRPKITSGQSSVTLTATQLGNTDVVKGDEVIVSTPVQPPLGGIGGRLVIQLDVEDGEPTQGPPGAPGAAGTNGSIWHTGSGVPAGGTGVNGDYYLNLTNGDVYQKSAGAWGSAIGNIRGPQGVPGSGGGSSAWTTIKKTANEDRDNTTTGTTLVSDNILFFPVQANEDYAFRAHIPIYVAGSGPDFKYQISGPAGIGSTYIEKRSSVAGISQTPTTDTVNTSYVMNLNNTIGYLIYTGIVKNGANAGVVAFDWAQNLSSATKVYVLSGAYLDWMEI